MTDFLGILGGMGPFATADFLLKLARRTPAAADQGHIPVVLYGDCTTPDRSANILGQGASPLPNLLAGIEFLNRSGAKAICIPCNSAHRWFDEMQSVSGVPLLHIVHCSASQIRKRKSRAKTVGVLSTIGTHRTGLYRDTLQEMGYIVLTPTSDEFDRLISPAIAMNKANIWIEAAKLYDEAASRLSDRGAEILVLGCTEIGLGMERQLNANPEHFVDSTDALVEGVVQLFFGVQVDDTGRGPSTSAPKLWHGSVSGT